MIYFYLGIGVFLMENNKTIDLSILNGKKIYIATPMYGGLATSNYIMSIIELTGICVQNNIELFFGFCSNESLVTRARNTLVSGFMEEEYDYLFFIDADIGFDKADFLYMIHAAVTENLDVICGAYPQKRIAWEIIEKARQNNLISKESDYSKYSGIYGINFEKEEQTINTKELNEVMECSTGFMLISRKTFNKFKNAYPEQEYKADKNDNYKKMFAYFDTMIDKDSGRYLSEDYMFCKYIKKLGIKIWLAPWIKLSHVGTNVFSGTYEGFVDALKKQ
jgi:hypothetical protein